MWRNVNPYYLLLVRTISTLLKKGRAASIYCAPGMVVGHVNSPGGCTIATVQDITEVCYWRKDESTIKDDVK